MRFLPWWRGWRNPDPAGNRLAKFRRVLEAAQNIPVYQASLHALQLDTRKSLRRVSDIESILSQLGVFTLDQVRVRPPRSPEIPTPVVSPLAPDAPPGLVWNTAGCAVLRDHSGSKSTDRALFVRIGLDEGLLSSIERDGLWKRYGVPMFEHMIGMDGELLAWECETHSGLHIVEGNAIFESVGGEILLTSLTDLVQPTLQTRTGWSARLSSEPCDCGRSGRRLIGLREFILYAGFSQRPDTLAVAARR
jgi:hypothetical protein